LSEKQHTAEFEQCIADVMKQGHEKGSAFAICTATFEKAQKPIFLGESEAPKLHLFSESIKLKGHKVSGVAIHPKRIFHPEENMTHVYLREELQNAAPTLIGKPFGIDHMYVLPPPNLITNAWYDPKEDGVAFEGTVDDQIAEQIEDEAFKGISIELNWLKPGGKVEFQNGVAPRNFELTSVHLLRRFPPGDKDAYIKFWNGIMEQLVYGPARTIDDRVDSLETQFKEMWTRVEVISGKIEVLSRSPPSSLSPSNTGMPGAAKLQVVIPIGEKAQFLGKSQEAEWTAEYINNLPDSAFAYIEAGGEKDAEGKTTPRSKRHLPFRNADGSLDADHVRNALARLDQTAIGSEAKGEAKKKLCAAAKELQIESEVCGLAPKQGESEATVALRKRLSEAETQLAEVQKSSAQKEATLTAKLAEAEKAKAESPDLVALRKQVVDTEAKLAESQKQVKAWQDKYHRFAEAVAAKIPIISVWKAWSGGPQQFVREVEKTLREFSIPKS